MIDPIVFFYLSGEGRKQISIKNTGGAGPARVRLSVTPKTDAPIAQIGEEFVYCAPFRDFDVIKNILPDDVSINDIPRPVVEAHFGLGFMKSDTEELPEPPEKTESVNILIVDGFQDHPLFMRKAEKELRDLRVSLLKRKVPCTLTVACSLNSSVYQAYNKENFQNFEHQFLPMSVRQLKAHNLLISMEGAHPERSAVWPCIKAFSKGK